MTQEKSIEHTREKTEFSCSNSYLCKLESVRLVHIDRLEKLF